MGQRARAVADLARGNPFLGIALGRWPESENRPRVAVPLGSRRRRRTAGSRTTAPQPTRPVGLAGSLLTAHEGPANAWCECAVRVDQSIDVLPRGDPPPEGSAASGSSASAETYEVSRTSLRPSWTVTGVWMRPSSPAAAWARGESERRRGGGWAGRRREPFADQAWTWARPWVFVWSTRRARSRRGTVSHRRSNCGW